MNKYQRGRLLGKGSFGAAYLATERSTGQQYVLKEISLARMQPEERKAARQEAEVRVSCQPWPAKATKVLLLAAASL
jgi:NIMA (never in mitosis gene a)-related kinase 1/4/5